MRVTIKTKLIGSFGVVLALLGAAGYFGISSLGQTNQAMTSFSEGPFVQVANGPVVKQELTDIRRAMWRMLITSDPKMLESLQNSVDANWRDMDARIDTLLAATPADQRDALSDLKPLLTQTRSVVDGAAERVALANNEAGDAAIVETNKVVGPLLADLRSLAATGGSAAALAETVASKVKDARFAAVSAVVRTPEDAISAAAAETKAIDAEIRADLSRLATIALPAQAALVQQMAASR